MKEKDDKNLMHNAKMMIDKGVDSIPKWYRWRIHILSIDEVCRWHKTLKNTGLWLSEKVWWEKAGLTVNDLDSVLMLVECEREPAVETHCRHCSRVVQQRMELGDSIVELWFLLLR